MKKRKRILSRIALFTVLTILVSVFDKADVKAEPGGYALTVTVDPDGAGSVTVLEEGDIPGGTSPYSVVADAGINVSVDQTNAGYIFSRWEVEGVDVGGSLDEEAIEFSMPENAVTITAHFVANETEPSPTPDPESTPPADPPADPPKNDDPETPYVKFLNDVKDQAKNTLRNFESNPNAQKGLTIEAGVWNTFDCDTCIELDKLIRAGVIININYLKNGELNVFYITPDLNLSLEKLCDSNGLVGFECIINKIKEIDAAKGGSGTPPTTPSPTPTPTPRMRPRDDDDDSPEESRTSIAEPSWTPAKAAATIAAEKAEKQQAAGTQMAAVQTLLRTLATTKPTDRPEEARKVIGLDMTKVDVLDRSTVNLLVLNNKFEYNIKIPVAGGLTTTVKIPANFNFRPFIKADGTMNIHEVLWSIILSRK